VKYGRRLRRPRFTGTTSSHIVNSRLMSYGSSFVYTIRQHGIYTARIFKGENPNEASPQTDESCMIAST
jgi:hypothetical protein